MLFEMIKQSGKQVSKTTQIRNYSTSIWSGLKVINPSGQWHRKKKTYISLIQIKGSHYTMLLDRMVFRFEIEDCQLVLDTDRHISLYKIPSKQIKLVSFSKCSNINFIIPYNVVIDLKLDTDTCKPPHCFGLVLLCSVNVQIYTDPMTVTVWQNLFSDNQK